MRALVTAAAAARASKAVPAAWAGATRTGHTKDQMALEQEPAVWHSLGTPASELRLEWTLPTGEALLGGKSAAACSCCCLPYAWPLESDWSAGQSFRWRQTGSEPLEFTGVIGQRAVRHQP